MAENKWIELAIWAYEQGFKDAADVLQEVKPNSAKMIVLFQEILQKRNEEREKCDKRLTNVRKPLGDE